MAIAKTASRNVAFKVARMREAIMQDQDEFITRNANFEDVVSEANDRAILEDIGCNADLYLVLLYRQSRRQYSNLDVWPAQR